MILEKILLGQPVLSWVSLLFSVSNVVQLKICSVALWTRRSERWSKVFHLEQGFNCKGRILTDENNMDMSKISVAPGSGILTTRVCYMFTSCNIKKKKVKKQTNNPNKTNQPNKINAKMNCRDNMNTKKPVLRGEKEEDSGQMGFHFNPLWLKTVSNGPICLKLTTCVSFLVTHTHTHTHIPTSAGSSATSATNVT